MKNKRTVVYVTKASVSETEHIKALCEILDAVNNSSDTVSGVVKVAQSQLLYKIY